MFANPGSASMHYDFVPPPRRQRLEWPNGKRLVVMVTLNLEYWDPVKDTDAPYYAGGPAGLPATWKHGVGNCVPRRLVALTRECLTTLRRLWLAQRNFSTLLLKLARSRIPKWPICGRRPGRH